MAKRFQLITDKSIYFPGEVVTGNLFVETTNEIKCRGIRISMTGKGHSHFVTGSGDNKETRTHTQLYTSYKKTVWGNVFKTPLIDEAGENAIFGPPWAPDEGVMSVILDETQHDIIVRVMDYDWGKKDDLLGEIYIDIRSYLGKGQVTLPLTRHGKPEKGEVTFSLTHEDTTVSNNNQSYSAPKKTVRLQIFTTTGLRKADMMGKNDVYVQAYVSPSPVVSGKALPEPVESLVLPPSNMTIPFSFLLPEDLPSSMVYNWGNYITYSVYANIDIAWRLDITTRIFFTVVQPHASATMMQRQTRHITREMFPRFCCCPCYCFPSVGTIKANSHTDRTGYAPGETIKFTFDTACVPLEADQRILGINVQIMQNIMLYAEGHWRSLRLPVGERRTIHKANNEETLISVPSVPPTYLGGLGQNTTWSGQVSRYGGRWARRNIDPIVWNYCLEVSVEVSVPGLSCDNLKATMNIPIVIGAMGLNVLPPFTDSAYWEKQEALSAPPSAQYMSQTPSAPPANGSEGEPEYAPAQVVNWRDCPQVVAALPTLATCTTVPFAGEATVIQDVQEDNAQKYSYKPTYYSSA